MAVMPWITVLNKSVRFPGLSTAGNTRWSIQKQTSDDDDKDDPVGDVGDLEGEFEVAVEEGGFYLDRVEVVEVLEAFVEGLGVSRCFPGASGGGGRRGVPWGGRLLLCHVVWVVSSE